MSDPVDTEGVRFSKAQGRLLYKAICSQEWSPGTCTFTTEADEVAGHLRVVAESFPFDNRNKELRVHRWSRVRVDVLLSVIRFVVESESIHPSMRAALRHRAREVMCAADYPVVDQLAWLPT